jgi:hypothetical protein
LRPLAVDSDNPDTVALRGPSALFPVGSIPVQFKRKRLAGCDAGVEDLTDWEVETKLGRVTFVPLLRAETRSAACTTKYGDREYAKALAKAGSGLKKAGVGGSIPSLATSTSRDLRGLSDVFGLQTHERVV